MTHESRSIYKILSISAIALIILPKINIITIPGQTAGIRLDDILILAIFALLTAIFLAAQININTKYLLPFAAFIIWGLTSFAINRTFPSDAPPANALYQIRYIEYFLFFFLGYSTYKAGIPLTRVAWIILISNGITMVLQYTNLIGGFASGTGYTPDASERVIGLTGGPWEVGALINFCFAIIAYNYTQNRNKFIKLIVLFSLTTYLIILTGARTPLLAHLIIFLACVYPTISKRPDLIIAATIALASASVLILNTNNSLTKRSDQLLNQSNYAYLASVYNDIDTSALINKEAEALASNIEGDLSWLLRATKWVIATSLYIESPPVYKVIGLGPGAWGPALDGGWLRITTELGIVGLALLLWLLWRVFRINTATKMLVISLSINMIFIDAHLSYKIMSVFFLAAGYLSKQKHQMNLSSILQAASHPTSPAPSRISPT